MENKPDHLKLGRTKDCNTCPDTIQHVWDDYVRNRKTGKLGSWVPIEFGSYNPLGDPPYIPHVKCIDRDHKRRHPLSILHGDMNETLNNLGKRLGEPELMNVNLNTWSEDEKTLLILNNIKEYLIAFIRDADVIVGTVAWINHREILEELYKKEKVSIIVQKDDFVGNYRLGDQISEFNKSFPSCFYRDDEILSSTLIPKYMENVPRRIEPFRCLGEVNTEIVPLQHRKVLVSLKKREDVYDLRTSWAGSLNVTHNGVVSYNEARLSVDRNFRASQFKAWWLMLLQSEPLDSKIKFMYPEILPEIAEERLVSYGS